MKRLVQFFSLFLWAICVQAQSIPVGTPLFEDYLRRLPLTGQLDSSSSLMIRPILPVEAFKLDHAFALDSSLKQDWNTSRFSFIYGKMGRRKFVLLPISYRSQYNSEYAFGGNDGVMIPNRGLQQVASLGLYADLWKFSIQLQPEFLTAQNRDYLGFPIEHQATILFYYEYMNRFDMPERFGNQPIKRLFPGQSSFRLNLNKISLGISTENLWWGLGR